MLLEIGLFQAEISNFQNLIQVWKLGLGCFACSPKISPSSWTQSLVCLQKPGLKGFAVTVLIKIIWIILDLLHQFVPNCILLYPDLILLIQYPSQGSGEGVNHQNNWQHLKVGAISEPITVQKFRQAGRKQQLYIQNKTKPNSKQEKWTQEDTSEKQTKHPET